MRRALFWQDLYSCFFVGTTRLLSHRDYEQFSHETIPASAPGSFVPSGFEKVIVDLPEGFIEILRDLGELCALVDSRCAPGVNTIEEYPIDNFQYCIESRLVDLLSENRNSNAEDFVLQACIFASFLITYKLSTGIWEGCFIPEYCATQVMSLLVKAEGDIRWKKEGFVELSLWLLVVSGSLAQRSRVRSQAISMIRNGCYDSRNRMHDQWDVLVELCRKFVWSSYSMEQSTWQFWQDVHSPRQQIGQSKYNDPIRMHPACTQLQIRGSKDPAKNQQWGPFVQRA